MPGPALILALLAGALALAALLAALVLRRPRLALAALVAAGGAGVAAGQAAAVSSRNAAAESLTVQVPALGRPQEQFTTSETCRSCHPDQYASWHRSFHRTMTQLATPATVTGDFAGVRLESRGRIYNLERVGEELWVEMVDPAWERELLLDGKNPDREPEAPRVRRQVVMTTGSHRMQTYWVSTGQGREVWNLPFVHLFEQDRWVPREDVFLRPPDERRFFAMWNNSCIDCHSTAGKVGFDFTDEVFDSRVAELGIACEACHGPAAEHIAANRDPLRRYRLHFTDAADPTVVQPERLDSRAASEVCGQCHGVSLSDEMDWLANGYRYRAGDELEAARDLVRPAIGAPADRLRELAARSPTAIASRFWPDGMVRVSGREYSGMLESGCFQRGELSCLSCHSLHASDPDDQLGAGMDGDEACLQCHDSYRETIEEHTRHPATSSGSRCYNCHMPHTTYGLLSAIRSHWIDSPSAAVSVATGRPNACNLCHLDRTLDWTADHMTEWYGAEPLALPPPERAISAALLWLLTGDAGQRALIAWSMGWEPALAASGSSWLAPYLGHLLNDPYATVRFIAQRSLRSQPRYRTLAYDYIAPEADRVAAREAVLARWFELPLEQLDRTGPELLIDASGNLDYPLLQELSRRRDDTPLFLAE
jgi:predicted CXXCH cytochrome family protein